MDFAVHIVNRRNWDLYQADAQFMFKRRHEVFIRDKKWSLKSTPSPIGELEIDQYDAVPTVEYLITFDSQGNQMGSTRFLPTEGPHLSNGPLQTYFSKAPPVGPEVWEVSRGISAPSSNHPLMARCHAILAAGIIEWALYRGVKEIISIMDERVVGAMLATGWRVELRGEAVSYPEGGRGVAIAWPADEATLKSTREICAISAPVLVHRTAMPLVLSAE